MEETPSGEQPADADDRPPPDDLQEQQTGKGYGEDEGEREKLLGDE